MKIIKSKYSESESPSPASTSREDEVTPPWLNRQPESDYNKAADLVRTRILEEHDALLLQPKARLLREEKVGAFDDVLKVRFPLCVD